MRHQVAVLLIAGCGSSSTPGAAAPPPPRPTDAALAIATGPATFAGVLTAPATVRSSAELTAHLVITNPGPDPMVLTRGALELAVLALAVRDAADVRVPTLPPPVPRPEDGERMTLAAGAALTRDYRLDVFVPPLPPGRYALHCRMVACAPAGFTVAR
jgi:hypothetical protein